MLFFSVINLNGYILHHYAMNEVAVWFFFLKSLSLFFFISPKSPAELLKLMQLWSLALVILFIAMWIPHFLFDDLIIP
jgi:hypothetical protein